jgi:hypothetical protein
VSIPPSVKADAEAALAEFCRQHTTEDTASHLRYGYAFETNSALLLEQRPGFLNPAEWSSKPLAKFRYSAAKSVWSLSWTESGEKWHRVSGVKPAADIRVLLQAVLKDDSGVFWG